MEGLHLEASLIVVPTLLQTLFPQRDLRGLQSCQRLDFEYVYRANLWEEKIKFNTKNSKMYHVKSEYMVSSIVRTLLQVLDFLDRALSKVLSTILHTIHVDIDFSES